MGIKGSKISQIFGLRIIELSKESPAGHTVLQPFVDFVIDLKNKPDHFSLEHDFYKFVIENENKDVELLIYNILSQKSRVVKFKLTRDWPNSRNLPTFPSRMRTRKGTWRHLHTTPLLIGLLQRDLAGYLSP